MKKIKLVTTDGGLSVEIISTCEDCVYCDKKEIPHTKNGVGFCRESPYTVTCYKDSWCSKYKAGYNMRVDSGKEK